MFYTSYTSAFNYGYPQTNKIECRKLIKLGQTPQTEDFGYWQLLSIVNYSVTAASLEFSRFLVCQLYGFETSGVIMRT